MASPPSSPYISDYDGPFDSDGEDWCESGSDRSLTPARSGACWSGSDGTDGSSDDGYDSELDGGWDSDGGSWCPGDFSDEEFLCSRGFSDGNPDYWMGEETDGEQTLTEEEIDEEAGDDSDEESDDGSP